MKYKIIILFALMFLSGCILTKPTKPPYTVYNGTRDLLYKNIEVAIHYLGYPNNTLTVVV